MTTASETVRSALPLGTGTLADIGRTGRVAVPDYDRAGLKAGILHFGVGGFHRSHLAMAVDRLLRQGEARDFGICGVGLLDADRRMAQVMADQDGLYTLVLKHADGAREARVIGSIVEYLFAPDDPEAVLERMSHPDVAIVSMTITEGGYEVDQTTGAFLADNPDLQHDLSAPGRPRTIFGFVTEALRRRRDTGVPPFTVLSCDNVQGNGHVARVAFTSFARLADPALGDWIDAHVPFPNSMVDRITPSTTDQDRQDVRADYGIDDAWPVVAEPFFQWVLEDEFSMGRPRFEHAGAQLVDDVTPYELMKLRLLNGSHQAMGYFGVLLGYRYAHEAAQDPDIAAFLRAYMDIEATPALEPVPGIDLAEYKASLIERFSNPHIGDTLARLCSDTSDRIPKFLLPVARYHLAHGGPVERVAAVCASWARYVEGTDEHGGAIEVVDRLAASLAASARPQHDEPTAFLRHREVFGDLAEEPRFSSAFAAALATLHLQGARATLKRFQ